MDRVASPSETLRHLTALLDLIRARPEHGAGALADVHGRPRSYTDDTSNETNDDINDDTGEDVGGRVLDGLVLLRELRTELAGWEPELIAAARRAGASWAQLAPALGVASRQAAERRYLRLQPTGGSETTKEARVAATRDRRAGDRAVTAWARQNSAELRQLAGQVSAVGGLSTAGQREADRVHAELAGDDAATLLGPLTDLRAHLADQHPSLAAQISTVTADADQHRHTTVTDRHPAERD